MSVEEEDDQRTQSRKDICGRKCGQRDTSTAGGRWSRQLRTELDGQRRVVVAYVQWDRPGLSQVETNRPSQLPSGRLHLPSNNTEVHLILSVVSPSSKRSSIWLQVLLVVWDAFTSLVVDGNGADLVLTSAALTPQLTAINKATQHGRQCTFDCC